MTARARAAAAAARLAGWTSRNVLRREGRTISGHVYLRLAGSKRRDIIPAGVPVVLVSGTNGKTTTTALIARAVATQHRVTTNVTGANLLTGIYGALAAEPRPEVIVLESDELALPHAVKDLRPTVVALLNLSRDQMDRMQEVRRTAATWLHTFAGFEGTIVANADDPLVVWAVRGAPTVVWVAAGQPWTVDATACPNCASFITFDASGWSCERCDLRRPDVVDLGDVPATSLPGRANRANAAIATAVLGTLGVARSATSVWMSLGAVAGRYREVDVDGRRVRLLLAKNPAGWQETLEMLDADRSLVLALNARTEDGTDPSWIWDVPFERLAGRTAVCAGERAADLAVRVDYAGLTASIEPDLLDAVRACPPGAVDFAGNYSAFRELARRA